MVAHGDARVEHWLTELGYSTCTSGELFCVRERQQAAYTYGTYQIARARWPFVRAVVTYNLRDTGTDGSKENGVRTYPSRLHCEASVGELLGGDGTGGRRAKGGMRSPLPGRTARGARL